VYYNYCSFIWSHINNEKIDDMGKNSFVFVIVVKVRLVKLFSVGDGGSCYDVITIPKTLIIDIEKINKGRDKKRAKEGKYIYIYIYRGGRKKKEIERGGDLL